MMSRILTHCIVIRKHFGCIFSNCLFFSGRLVCHYLPVTYQLLLVCFLSALAEKFSDIFFLLDSGVSAGEFQQVRSILVRLVNQLNVGGASNRLGFAQYGQDVKVEFFLNTFRTKEETLTAVKRLRQRKLQANEQRYLGSALKNASTQFFTSEAGSRADQGYRQYLVVVSGKDSDDPVHKSARRIKLQGVTVAGMSVGASMIEMRVISTAPYAYDSISNAVPVLKAVFEKQDQEATLTGGEKLFNYTFIIKSTTTTIYSVTHFQSFRCVRFFKLTNS